MNYGLARSVGILFAMGAVAPPIAMAQGAIIAVEEENLRATPNGVVLAELLEGTPLVPGETRGRWRQATLEAWIWAPSVRADDRQGHDLAVSAEGGENLRATPNGRRLGRAREGMLLDRLEVRGDWVRVRRTAWIWEPSIRLAADPSPPPARESTREFIPAGAPAVVRSSPGGDTLARLHPGASVEVLERDGDWARVRVEGWTFVASLGADTGAAVLTGITREELQAEPDAYRGRLLEWTVQYIAVQEAERFRTDFLPGERFILARGPGDDAGFVYVVVPTEHLDQVEALAPLQRIRVLGRIRTAASALTGAPVLDLVEITGR